MGISANVLTMRLPHCLAVPPRAWMAWSQSTTQTASCMESRRRQPSSTRLLRYPARALWEASGASPCSSGLQLPHSLVEGLRAFQAASWSRRRCARSRSAWSCLLHLAGVSCCSNTAPRQKTLSRVCHGHAVHACCESCCNRAAIFFVGEAWSMVFLLHWRHLNCHLLSR